MLTSLENFQKREIIVNYDISNDYKEFKKALFTLLRAGYGGTKIITESTYKIRKKLDDEGVKILSTLILKLFADHRALLESVDNPKKVIVILIRPNGNTFIVDEIINEVVE